MIFSLVLTSVILPVFAFSLSPLPAQAEVNASSAGLSTIKENVDKLGEACNGWNLILKIKLDCIILNTVWLVDKFLAGTFLAAATYIFDISISYNLTDIAGTSPFVKVGWGIVRDIANLFFIFILLWIALATIFDISGYGAKDLLRQLIIAALLINFSLAIGGFFINFTNALGRAFLGSLRGGSCVIGNDLSCAISAKLLAFTHIQQVTNEPTSAAERKSICEKEYPTSASRGGADKAKLYYECLIYDSVAQTVRAGQQGAVQSAIYQALWLIVIIPILSFVFFAGAIFFLARYLMLSYLLVFAPIVFLFFILPTTKHYWTEWWSNLIKWSFFAPAFFFLLFLTIETFDQLAKINVAQGKGFFGIGFDMILLIAMMVINLMLAQKMGIYGASTVTGWGKSAQKWAGTTARGIAYRGAVRGAAPMAKALTESRTGRFLAGTPGLRALTTPALAIQEQREKIDADRAKQIERASAVSPDLALARLNGEAIGVQAAFAKSASPENLGKLLKAMPDAKAQENFISRLSANKEAYGLTDILDKKVGEAMVNEANGLTLRVVAKTGKTSDNRAEFQQHVNNYLGGLTDPELAQAMTAKSISGNAFVSEYILKNFKNEMRIGRATLDTPEKIKELNEIIKAAGGKRAFAQEMKNRGNDQGAKDILTSLIMNVLDGAAARPFIARQGRRRNEQNEDYEDEDDEGGEDGGGEGNSRPRRPTPTQPTSPSPSTPPPAPPTRPPPPITTPPTRPTPPLPPSAPSPKPIPPTERPRVTYVPPPSTPPPTPPTRSTPPAQP
ncbi:MAG: hypothetical protein Q7R91_01595 [bacterium]|nr:hypothetical protein [bacterium]